MHHLHIIFWNKVKRTKLVPNDPDQKLAIDYFVIIISYKILMCLFNFIFLPPFSGNQLSLLDFRVSTWGLGHHS